MAEAFALAASIIAVIQIADRIISLCRGYIESVEGAPRDLRAVLIETSSLQAIFKSLEYLNGKDSDDSSSILQNLSGPIEGCNECITKLEQLFPRDCLTVKGKPKRQKLKATLVRLAWPIHGPRAMELLREMSGYKSTMTMAFCSDISRDVKEVKKAVGKLINGLNDTKIREFCQWLVRTNPSSLHNRACKDYEPGTGDWVLRTPEWKDWLSITNGSRRCLWMHGIPGAGKTVLASHLVEEIKQHCGQAVNQNFANIYYYCYYAHNQDESVPFLEWTLSQLCRHATVIPDLIYKGYEKDQRPRLEELLSGLEDVLKKVGAVYITLDAVDESEERSNLLRVIRDLSTDPRFGKIQLFVTSREYFDIERTMEPISTPLSMSNSFVQEDIERYVNVRLTSSLSFQHWPFELREEVKDALAKGAKGMFRWVVCQLDILRRLRTFDTIRNTLQHLPKDLDETYERIFSLIFEEDKLLVQHTLRWIYFHEEFNDEFGDPGPTPAAIILGIFLQSTDESSSETCPIYSHDAFKEACGCLVRFYQYDGAERATLAHYTVREFLTSTRLPQGPATYFKFPTTHPHVYCIQTIFLQGLAIDFEDLPVTVANSHLDTHLDSYLLYWIQAIIEKDHGTLSEVEQLTDLVFTFLNPTSTHFPRLMAWRQQSLNDDCWNIEWIEYPDIPEAAIVTHLGYHGCMNLLEALLPRIKLQQVCTQKLNIKIYDEDHLMFFDASECFEGTTLDFFATAAAAEAEYLTLKGIRGRKLLILQFLIHKLQKLVNPSRYFALYVAASSMTASSMTASSMTASSMTASSMTASSMTALLEANNFDRKSGDICLDILASLGADPSGAQLYVTPLQIACGCGSWELAESLLKMQADPNATGHPQPQEWDTSEDSILCAFDALHGYSPLHIVQNLEAFRDKLGYKSEKLLYWPHLKESIDELQQLLMEYGAKSIDNSRPYSTGEE
ncbi:hypothetical protein F4677DRAFT_419289 [Hypoxylon crocopeplum]|nr:hypothetical protein F4677DRAFT_419289 [Hypoxylon crocopeplum]